MNVEIPSDTTWEIDAKLRAACSRDVAKRRHILRKVSVGMTLDTTLENRHHQNTPYLKQVSLGMPFNTKLENRRRASRHNIRHI
jgi:hypothetical protein